MTLTFESVDYKTKLTILRYVPMLKSIAINMLLAVSLSVVVGFLGELSLGHAGFMCVGAYFGGIIAVAICPSLDKPTVLSVIVAILLGGLVAGACGFIVGLPALRLKGDYLAIVTLAFGEIVRVIFTNAKVFGGAQGMPTPRFDRKYLFVIGLLLVLATIAVIQNLLKSKHGRSITAIRDNEIAAKATGINVTKYKLIVFALSSAFAGVAGVLYSYSNFNIQPAKFGYNYSIEILVMVVLGGMGKINGSIIAAALITFLNTKLPLVLTGELAVLQNLFYALILILLVIYNNAPALKGFREKYNFKNLWNKIFKPKHDPSKVRDDAARWDVVPTKIAMDEVLSTDVVIDNYGDNSADIGERGGNK
jgi:branched-chain amino acid transport system permease protein